MSTPQDPPYPLPPPPFPVRDPDAPLDPDGDDPKPDPRPSLMAGDPPKRPKTEAFRSSILLGVLSSADSGSVKLILL